MGGRISSDRKQEIPFILDKGSGHSYIGQMNSLSSKLAYKLINYYQSKGGGSKLFNTDCNFDPTCSEYAKEAIKALGLFAAIPIIIDRLSRCNDPDKVERVNDPFKEKNNV